MRKKGKKGSVQREQKKSRGRDGNSNPQEKATGVIKWFETGSIISIAVVNYSFPSVSGEREGMCGGDSFSSVNAEFL